MNQSKKIVGVIPARWNSSRFPGKPLANILGKSLIHRTFENAKRCKKLDAVVIATDDIRVFEHAKWLGAEVFMTSLDCPTGTDRVWEVVDRHFSGAEVIVNIQGDEPCLNPEVVDHLVTQLQAHPEAQLTTPITTLSDPLLIQNQSIVKCVFDKKGKALYFSRSPIPFVQKKPHSHYRHIGIYCFRREMLKKYVALCNTPLQDCEDLEQLKMVENGFSIFVCPVNEQAIGVDTPEDIKIIENLLCQRESICLSPEEWSPPWAKV